MIVLRRPEDLLAFRRAEGDDVDLGFVPTMGALHEGHFALVEESRRRHARTAVSIYVNPLQFGPNEDYLRYPRTLEADLAGLETAGADVVFAPEAADLQAELDPIRVKAPRLGDELCGAFRPGHFDGVLTIVLRLFRLVRPRAAYFGLKDRQQYALIRRMTDEFLLDVDVVGLPTVRDADGLALSSRNRYLSDEERAKAPLLYATLRALAEEGARKRVEARSLTNRGRATLEDAGFKVDYLECRGPARLEKLFVTEPDAVWIAAAWLGRTRLIDNVQAPPPAP